MLVNEARLQRTLATFAERVRTSRVELGLSQQAAAARAGINQSHWSKVERGVVDPSLGQVLRIQIALSAPSVEGLFGAFPTAQVAEDAEVE
jgi:predicted transcriptional regulator